MFFTLPYTYKAEAPTGRGGVRQYWLDGKIDIVPKVIEGYLAPVSLLHKGWSGHHNEYGDPEADRLAFGPPEPNEKVAFRNYEGAQYEPLRHYKSVDGHPERIQSALLTEGNVANLKNVVQCLRDVSWVQQRMQFGYLYEQKKFWSENTKIQFEKSDRSQAEEAMNELARDLIVIDGVLHRRTSEPVFVVDEGYVGVKAYERTDDAQRLVFRIDEGREMQAMMSAIYDGSIPERVRQSIESALAEVELVDPALLTLRLGDSQIATAGHRLFSEVQRKLHEHPLEVLLAFDDLRSALFPQRKWVSDIEMEPEMPVGERMALIADRMTALTAEIESRCDDPHLRASARIAKVSCEVFASRAAAEAGVDLEIDIGAFSSAMA